MRGSVVYIVSIAVHFGFAGALYAVKEPKRVETQVITMVNVKVPPKPKPADPPPPPPAPEAPAKAPPRAKPAAPPPAAPKAAPAAAPAEGPAPASSVSNLPDFGIALSGGGGPGGIAVPTAAAPAAKPAAPARPKVLEAAPPQAAGCGEPATKPTPIEVVQPAYTEEARTAEIEGKVRVEITVDASGRVTNARVLSGLGHGLDEAALEAARNSRFEPGKACGQPIETTFVIGMRFSL